MAQVISQGKVLKKIQEQFLKKTKLAQVVYNASQYVEKGDSSVTFPTRAPRTAQKQKVGSENFTLTANNYGSDLMLLDDTAGCRFPISINLEKENLFDGESDGMSDSLSAIGVALESDLIAKSIAGAGEIPQERTAVFSADVLNIRKYFVDNNIPLSEVYLCVTSEDEVTALNDPKFVAATDNAALATGVLGTIYGINIMVLASYAEMTESFAIHKDGIVFAWHGELTVQIVGNNQNASKDVLVANKYGTKVLQSGALIRKWSDGV